MVYHFPLKIYAYKMDRNVVSCLGETIAFPQLAGTSLLRLPALVRHKGSPGSKALASAMCNLP